MHQKVPIGKIKFSKITLDSLLNHFSSIIEISDRCHQVVVANVYSVYTATKDNDFYKICNTADIVLPDGLPVVWASKILRRKLPERITGPDFMWTFSGICAKKGYGMFLLGGRKEYLDNLIANLKNAYPDILIAGAYSPPFGEWSEAENSKIIGMINDSNADIVWLGISTPKQDKWIFANKQKLRAKVAVGVGAAFDFHSGRVKRAPQWIQKTGLEWMFRLLQEPQRMWKKYLYSNTLFVLIIVKELIKINLRLKKK